MSILVSLPILLTSAALSLPQDQTDPYAGTVEDDLEADTLELNFVGRAEEKVGERQLQDDYIGFTRIRNTSNGKGVGLWRLNAEYTYIYEPDCLEIRVPPNFVTDFASIPGVARSVYNPADYAEAALVHDWLYANGFEGKRPLADRIFREALIETGHGGEAQVLYSAVRFGGNNGYGLAEDLSFFQESDKSVEQLPDEFRPTEEMVYLEIDCDASYEGSPIPLDPEEEEIE